MTMQGSLAPHDQTRTCKVCASTGIKSKREEAVKEIVSKAIGDVDSPTVKEIVIIAIDVSDKTYELNGGDPEFKQDVFVSIIDGVHHAYCHDGRGRNYWSIGLVDKDRKWNVADDGELHDDIELLMSSLGLERNTKLSMDAEHLRYTEAEYRMAEL